MSVKFIYKSDGNVDIVVAPEIPVSPRTFRQLLANRPVIDRIRAENIDISRYSDSLTLLEKKRSGCFREAFEPYRILSPLVSKFSTDDIRKIVASRPQNQV